MKFKASSASPSRPLGIRTFLLMWPLFFAICFGLGYPTLQRYDPRTTEGMSDTPKYYAITTGADTSGFKEMFRCRVLVPYVARPFYWFAQKYLPTWNAGFFGLLMANALFCATTACLIASIGNKLLNDSGTAFFGAMLYLSSFAVSNLQLAGLIDSGEACLLAALLWSLLSERWYLLPLWGVLGALAKETFVPFSIVFAFTWWLVARRESANASSQVKWIVALAVTGLATVMAVHSAVSGELKWPWAIAGQAKAPVNFFVALWHCLTERSFWYVFGWLIPLGIWRLQIFPRPWRVAAISTSILAILLGAYSNAGGTVGRATFNIIGPLLSLSVAALIVRTANFAKDETGIEHAS
ncbi:MAG TPA: hypothetical protein VGO68_04265 [Pyrinomonadaceae bacterium]|jgi:hypothetical protein|nr:hypothetical protein [Pyrinomonadaceae bacterium]